MPKPKISNVVLAGYIDEPSFARQIKQCHRTVQEWRRLGKGPPYTQIGREFYYRIEAAREWLLSGEHKPPRGRTGRRPNIHA
jgi:hypothetical protein